MMRFVSSSFRPNCFQIVVSGAEVYLCADTTQQREDWMECLYDSCASVGTGRPRVAADKEVRLVRFVTYLKINLSENKGNFAAANSRISTV